MWCFFVLHNNHTMLKLKVHEFLYFVPHKSFIMHFTCVSFCCCLCFSCVVKLCKLLFVECTCGWSFFWVRESKKWNIGEKPKETWKGKNFGKVWVQGFGFWLSHTFNLQIEKKNVHVRHFCVEKKPNPHLANYNV